MEKTIEPWNGRYFTDRDFEKGASPGVAAIFDQCAVEILNGGATLKKPPHDPNYANPQCFGVSGWLILPDSVLTWYLGGLVREGFDYGKAFAFSEIYRQRFGWDAISFRLENWFEKQVRKAYPIAANAGEGVSNEINPDLLRFACHIAIGNMKYGPSHARVTANRIFDHLTALGSDLPVQLKKYGSGELPKEIAEFRDGEVSCKANDAFATITISVRTEAEENYAKALDFLCRLLGQEFPRSYAIGFKSPERNFLPIRGLPNKGAHRLCANAVRYLGLHERIERYARLAMREYEWYTDLEDEDCAMPGTFAVFALGLHDEKYTPLVLDYLKLCDAEHSSIQNKFVTAYVGKYGLGENGTRVFLAGVESTQALPPDTVFAAAVQNGQSLRFLLAAKKNLHQYLWQNVLYALWGDDVVRNGGKKTLKSAPEDLRPLIEEMLRK